MIEQNKDVVRRYFDLFNQGRLDNLMALLADDFRLIGMGMPVSGVNHDLSAQDFAALAKSRESFFAEPMIITIEQLVADENTVVCFAQSRAETALGVAYANQYAFAFELCDGKICAIREYCCTYSVVHVLRDGGIGLPAGQTG